MNQTEIEYVRKFQVYLNENFVQPLKHIPSPILRVSVILQLIDCLGTYYYGKWAKGTSFAKFWYKYIKGTYGNLNGSLKVKYGPTCKNEKLFKGIYALYRNRLAHNAIFGGVISVGHSQVVWIDKPEKEWKMTIDKVPFIDANQLYDSFQKAFNEYFNDVCTDKTPMEKFMAWDKKIKDDIKKALTPFNP